MQSEEIFQAIPELAPFSQGSAKENGKKPCNTDSKMSVKILFHLTHLPLLSSNLRGMCFHFWQEKFKYNLCDIAACTSEKVCTCLLKNISNRAVFTWLSKGIGFGFGFGFTTPFSWLAYLLWFWFYDSQVKTAL